MLSDCSAQYPLRKSIQVEREMLHLTEDDFFETKVDDDNDDGIDEQCRHLINTSNRRYHFNSKSLKQLSIAGVLS